MERAATKHPHLSKLKARLSDRAVEHVPAKAQQVAVMTPLDGDDDDDGDGTRFALAG